MFTRVHHSWNLVSQQLRRMIRARYGVELDTLVIGPHDPTAPTPLTYRPDRKRLQVSYKLLENPEMTAPFGPVTEAQVHLQQPRLFGGIAATFAPHRHSPWRDRVAAGSEPDAGDYATALMVDQVRAEARESRRRSLNRLLMQSYTAHHLLVRPPIQHLRDMIEVLVIGVYARVVSGAAAGADTDMIPDLVRSAITDVVGQEEATQLTSLVTRLLEADGSNPAELLLLGKQWRTLVEPYEHRAATVGRLSVVLMRCTDILRAAVDRDVRLLQLKYPPLLTSVARTAAPSTLEEWVNELADEPEADAHSDDYDNGDDFDEQVVEGPERVVGISENRWVEYRPPNDREIAQAAAVSQRLRALRYRQPQVTGVASQRPGGRLDTRQLVQFTAQRTAGTAVTATPWSRAERTAVDQPGLTCALVLDTSMSMGTFRRTLMSLNWVLAQATTAVGGTISAWGFGGDAFEIVRAGTQPRLVPDVHDGGNNSDGSAKALAQAAAGAGLVDAEGTRVAVVVTDASLPEKESADLSGVFTTLREQGVHTLMLHVGHNRRNPQVTGADIVSCEWSGDLAQVLTEQIMAAYTAS